MDITSPIMAATNSKASIEKSDLEVLLPIVHRIAPRTILEIGAWRGHSIKTFMEAFTPTLAITVENEPDALDYISKRTDIPSVTLISRSSQDGETPELVKQALGGTPVDFLFIDGDHHYNAVKRDYRLYSSFVRTGGIIAFHDICYTSPAVSVRPLWEALKHTSNYLEIRTSLNSTGIGVLFV